MFYLFVVNEVQDSKTAIGSVDFKISACACSSHFSVCCLIELGVMVLSHSGSLRSFGTFVILIHVDYGYGAKVNYRSFKRL